jgi:hypothetical protein
LYPTFSQAGIALIMSKTLLSAYEQYRLGNLQPGQAEYLAKFQVPQEAIILDERGTRSVPEAVMPWIKPTAARLRNDVVLPQTHRYKGKNWPKANLITELEGRLKAGRPVVFLKDMPMSELIGILLIDDGETLERKQQVKTEKMDDQPRKKTLPKSKKMFEAGDTNNQQDEFFVEKKKRKVEKKTNLPLNADMFNIDNQSEETSIPKKPDKDIPKSPSMEIYSQTGLAASETVLPFRPAHSNVGIPVPGSMRPPKSSLQSKPNANRLVLSFKGYKPMMTNEEERQLILDHRARKAANEDVGGN